MGGRHRAAYTVIILFGIVSLSGDIIYEGARSVSGPCLHMPGAGALAFGAVAGFGGFLGYALRLVSGYLADTTRHHWAIRLRDARRILAGRRHGTPSRSSSGSWWRCR